MVSWTPGSAARLALWLGPWAGSRVPRRIDRSRVVLDAPREVDAYVYRRSGRHARGVYLVAPGLHFAGPDDPRLDRFCRVLAHAGFVVVAPLLPDFLALRIAETTTRDLAAAFEHAVAIAESEGLGRPAVFSISFGSRPAIELCASPAGVRASALILFGGFCDFDATVRFALTGRAAHAGRAIEVPHDPLNAPVVHLNLLDHHDAAVDKERVARALRRMVHETWGRAELKVGRARAPFAERIAGDLELTAPDRAFFFAACGLSGDGGDLAKAALERSSPAFAWVDARPHLARMRPPVFIVHGRDDDVIPWCEAEKLAAALPPSHPREVVLTGLYGHTGAVLPSPRALVREASALSRVVSLLSEAPLSAPPARRPRSRT